MREWHSLCIVADSKPKRRKTNPTGAKVLWTMIETSVPIPLGTGVYFVRVLYNTAEERKYLDIRRWKEITSKHGSKHVPTDDGLTIPLDQGGTLLEVAFKILARRNK